MLSCLDVARYFIIRAYEDGKEASMTNMKVQKLLYYAQSLYLALYDEPLFEDEIQAWRYGPVCPPAYHFYSDFEAKQLPVPDRDFVTVLPHNTRSLLEEVWDYFGTYHAYFLSDMTHLEYPWRKARRNLPPTASSVEPIALPDMHFLGQQKLEEIEREHPAYAPIMTQLLQQAFSKETQPEYVKQGEVRDWLSTLLN
jgi:uncharacterized phage-associated protein